MASVVPFTRSLAHIVTDLATTQQRIAALDATAQSSDLTDAEDTLWGALEDRATALRAEADMAFYAATGVAWDRYERVRA